MWPKISKFLAISLFLFVALNPAANARTKPKATHAESAPVSTHETGPKSPEEAEVLWESGNRAFTESSWEEAITNLQRYISRYPGKPHFLKSHLLLGQALLARQDFSAAAKPLRYFADATKDSGERVLGRALLAQAYLGQKKFHEAFLATQEAEKIYRKDESLQSQRDLLVRTLIAKTQALIGIGDDLHEKLAIIANDGALQVAQNSSASDLVAQAWVNSLRLKTWQCSKFPSAKKLSEEQVKDQMDRRGTCLLEAMKIQYNLFQTQDITGTQQGNALIVKAWQEYLAAADAPPPPLPLKPKDRTATQIKRYYAELSSFLRIAAHQDLRDALAIIAGWTLPAKMHSARDVLKDEIGKLLPPGQTS